MMNRGHESRHGGPCTANECEIGLLDCRSGRRGPGLTQGSRGRIRLDPATQRLCLWEPHEHDPSGLLSCSAWTELCGVALQPAVERIRGTERRN